MRVPSYRLHKPSGRALVEIDGRRIYLGKHGTAASKTKYKKKIAEWAARNGKTIEGLAPTATSAAPMTITELVVRYWTEHVTTYYQKRGQPTTTQLNIRTSLKLLRRLNGDTAAADFDQIALDAYRDEMIDAGNCIKTINDRVNDVRRAFRWGARKKLVPAAAWQNLLTVENLKAGRTRAKAGRGVKPVPDKVIEQTLPHLSDVVAAMVRFQRLTGCRPGEVCSIRPCDIERPKHPLQQLRDDAPAVLPMRPAGDGAAPIGGEEPGVWCYRPEGHKTEHHGIERRVYIGPRAQDVLRPYLDRDPEAFCFCPREAHAQDVGGLNDRGEQTRHAPRFGRTGGRRYDKNSYRKAIIYGLCRLARAMGKEVPRPAAAPAGPEAMPRKRWRPPTRKWFESNGVPYWHPSQIRHSAATQLEFDFDHDAARVVLGHGDERTTRIYAERDFSKAAEVARQIG